jgi:hypothetical protein
MNFLFELSLLGHIASLKAYTTVENIVKGSTVLLLNQKKYCQRIYCSVEPEKIITGSNPVKPENIVKGSTPILSYDQLLLNQKKTIVVGFTPFEPENTVTGSTPFEPKYCRRINSY